MTTTQHLAIFLAVLVVGLVAINVWGAGTEAERDMKEAQEAQQREAARDRARAALIATAGTPFHAGAMAAIDGDDMLDNPHCTPGGAHDLSMAWHCGWIHGRKLLQHVGGQP
jgi:hypothetical protein